MFKGICLYIYATDALLRNGRFVIVSAVYAVIVGTVYFVTQCVCPKYLRPKQQFTAPFLKQWSVQILSAVTFLKQYNHGES